MDYFKALLLLFSILGFSYGDLSSRIIGGHEAVPHSAPFMVSIATMRTPPEINQHFCGGSILNVRWVLSAAHCLHMQLLREYIVTAGQHNRTLDNPNNRQSQTVDFFVNHPNWDPMGPTLSHDISTVRLSEPFTFNEFVSAINLPPNDEITHGPGTVYGWGRFNHEVPWELSDVLNTLTVNVIRFEECIVIMNRFQMSLDPTSLCTANKIEDSGVCNTDSGGPLVKGEGLNKRLIGIVSWAPGGRCGRADSADVFVRVSAFNNWILERITE